MSPKANERLYKIVDGEAAKTVGFFRTRAQAEAAFQRFLNEIPSARHAFVLVTMDKEGLPLSSEDAGSFQVQPA